MSSYARKPERVNVCIVGSGSTGGTVAKVLTEAGLSVVGIERGPWLQPKDFSMDEIKYLGREYLHPDPRLKPRTRRADENSKAEVFPFSPLPQLVGGGSVHWNAWTPRPKPSDFRQLSIHGPVEGASLADWPISYEDLEPYLTKVEWELGVSGLARPSPHEAPRSGPYPCPPPPVTAFGRKFYEATTRMGIDAGPVPQGMVTRPHNGRPAAQATGFWNLYGDPTLGKSTTLTSFIPAALATGLYDLRADCYVSRVLVGRDGRATGVLYLDPDGREVHQEADLVILCASAIEFCAPFASVHLEPLSGRLGQQQRSCWQERDVSRVLLRRRLLRSGKTDPLYGWTGYYINGGSFQFYENDESRGHLNGCFIQASGTLQPINWTMPDRPLWGKAMKRADLDYFNYGMKIAMILHDMPRETNQIDLDPTSRMRGDFRSPGSRIPATQTISLW